VIKCLQTGSGNGRVRARYKLLTDSNGTGESDYPDFGDGIGGITNGNGYGKNKETRTDGGMGEGYFPELVLACADPTRLDCLVINIVCRMEP
jgi:hypothetical protein